MRAEALAALDHLVVQEIFLTETACFAGRRSGRDRMA
jgi:predicted molibdopterin-dependent oxidoreductase YjgC